MAKYNIPRGTDLKGNTLRVYTYIFKVRQSGVREVQHALGLTSVSLAQYHLDKLVEMGLVGREVRGAYVLEKEIRVETLEQFLKIGPHIFPRFLLYTVILTVLFSYAMYATRVSIVGPGVWTIAIGLISVSVTWYETVRSWKKGP